MIAVAPATPPSLHPPLSFCSGVPALSDSDNSNGSSAWDSTENVEGRFREREVLFGIPSPKIHPVEPRCDSLVLSTEEDAMLLTLIDTSRACRGLPTAVCSREQLRGAVVEGGGG